jgi:chaperone modulatory protein CbpM
MTLLSTEAVVEAIVGLNAQDLDRWVAVGWVLPHGADQPAKFDVADVARVRLILELYEDLRVDEHAIPIVLSLLDQLYATRRVLRDVLSAVEQQSPSVHAEIKLKLKLDPGTI